MEKTKELDKHWAGYYWCKTCEMYTGQLERHNGHEHEYLPVTEDR